MVKDAGHRDNTDQLAMVHRRDPAEVVFDQSAEDRDDRLIERYTEDVVIHDLVNLFFPYSPDKFVHLSLPGKFIAADAVIEIGGAGGIGCNPS